jgi:hypothetical protein
MTRGTHNTKTDQRALEAFQRAFESQSDRVNEAEALFSRLIHDEDQDKKIDALGKQTSALAATALTQIGRLWSQVVALHTMLRVFHSTDEVVELTLADTKVRITKGGDVTLATGSASVVLKKNGDIAITGNKITVSGAGDVVLKGAKIVQN